MKTNSRTTNTFYNFISGIGGQLIAIILQFVVRTVFIHTLGKSYLGINGLFSNILTMLSLAEFGVGSAILYKLYEPIATNNYRRITLLMKLYRNIYQIIGVVVLGLGVCMIPALPYIISDYDKLITLNINAIFIFCLYLMKTVSSYFFFAYKSAIIRANQREYLLNIISYMMEAGLAVLQIVTLLLFRNFNVYVCMGIAEVILKNIIYAKLSDRLYPYINECVSEHIESSEIKSIFKDCAALFLYKLNGVVLKATDNIVISIFLGLEKIALYSNYYILYATINTIFSKVYSSVAHSLGNLHKTSTPEHSYKIFEAMLFVTIILGGTAGIGLFVVADELVYNWIGNEWIIVQPFALLLGIEAFTLALRIAIYKYRTSMGLFQQAKYRPIFGMIINLVVSVYLVRNWGLCGVLVGTILSDWLTTIWYDPMVIHKYGFNSAFPARRYYAKLFKYICVLIFIGTIDWYICNHFIVGYGWLSVIVHSLICAITVPVVLWVSMLGTEESKYLKGVMKSYSKKIVKRLSTR